MRNLILFIGRNNFVFLYVFLSLVSLYLLVNQNKFHNSSFLHSSSALTGSIYDVYADVTGYFNLKEQNLLLQEENRKLRNYSDMAYLKQFTTDRKIVDKGFKQRYTFMSGEVISNTSNLQKNYFTINIGSRRGVKEEMAVTSPMGVVGIVKAVSPHFSTVMSVLHTDTRVSAKIKKTGHYGPLSWDGKDGRFGTLNAIPSHAKLAIGDKIISSGYSVVFPEGLLIGTIESFDNGVDQYFYTIKVRLSAPFRKLRYVYVVKDWLQEEQKILEDETVANDS